MTIKKHIKLICVICDEPIIDDKYGHSAHPVKDGKCCSACNVKVVLPRRLALIK